MFHFILAGFILTSTLEAAETPAWEVSPSVAFYSGDATRASFLGGLSVAHRWTSEWWLGVDFYGGSSGADQPNGLQLGSSEKFLLLNTALYWNRPVNLGRDFFVPKADFYGSLGMGHFWLGGHGEVFGFIGGGLILHTSWNRLSMKFDLKNLFFVLENSGGDDFNTDMSLSLGPCWVF